MWVMFVSMAWLAVLSETTNDTGLGVFTGTALIPDTQGGGQATYIYTQKMGRTNLVDSDPSSVSEYESMHDLKI